MVQSSRSEQTFLRIQRLENQQGSQKKDFSRMLSGAGLIFSKDLVPSNLYQSCFASYS